MIHFDSFKDYISFATARKFVSADGETFKPQTGREKIGGFLAYPILKPAHFCMKNIRNPLMIAALTVSALFLSTLLFYPATLSAILVAVPAIKLTAYLAVQTTIIGLCLRTLGRLGNKELMEKWDAGQLMPVGIGSLRV